MESGDASDEEAPPCDPKSNNLTKKSGQKRFPWLLAWKPKMASKDMLSWSLPRKIQLAHADLLYNICTNILLLLCTPVGLGVQ